MSSGEKQATTGNLRGRVTDNNGQRLPGAEVTLSGPDPTQVQFTDPFGEFRFPALAPGTYQIVASLVGFSTVIHENIDIRTGRNTTIEIALSPAIAH